VAVAREDVEKQATHHRGQAAGLRDTSGSQVIFFPRSRGWDGDPRTANRETPRTNIGFLEAHDEQFVRLMPSRNPRTTITHRERIKRVCGSLPAEASVMTKTEHSMFLNGMVDGPHDLSGRATQDNGEVGLIRFCGRQPKGVYGVRHGRGEVQEGASQAA
jgi:hypothetical protein